MDQADLEAAIVWPSTAPTRSARSSSTNAAGSCIPFHAPEVECIGKGNARVPYEFGVKASIITINARASGGQFVLHATAPPGNPCDGNTLRTGIEQMQRLTDRTIERAHVDKGYRGYDAPNPHHVFISGQKRGVFGVIKRELEEPVKSPPHQGHLHRARNLRCKSLQAYRSMPHDQLRQPGQRLAPCSRQVDVFYSRLGKGVREYRLQERASSLLGKESLL
jgi:IS5 family transposase